MRVRLQLQSIPEALVQKWETAVGYYIGVDQLLYGRDMLRECFQGHSSDFPELSWDGTRYRVLKE